MDFSFIPTIGEGGDYFFRNEAALNVPLSSHWSLKLANIVDYNSNPNLVSKQRMFNTSGLCNFRFDRGGESMV